MIISGIRPGRNFPIMELVNRIVEWKRNLNLPSAGSYENLHREARSKSSAILASISLFM